MHVQNEVIGLVHFMVVFGGGGGGHVDRPPMAVYVDSRPDVAYIYGSQLKFMGCIVLVILDCLIQFLSVVSRPSLIAEVSGTGFG